MDSSAVQIVVHLEARLLSAAKCQDRGSIIACIRQWLYENFNSLSIDQEIYNFGGCSLLEYNLDRLSVTEAVGSSADIILLNEVELHIYLYKLHSEQALGTLCSGGGEEPAEDSQNCRAIELPCESLDGLWESLVFEPDIKNKLLRFISTLSFFAAKKVSFVTISFNRLVLLHGPPGSGKTSLARALAQKLSIRLSNQYSRCRLIEINSHSLFSKYFSESAKLVGALFDQIIGLLSDSNLFIIILIDEVETLISSRKSAFNGNEPTDGLRVVNALLTALDKIRIKNNVIVLTTSNLMQAMDPAFLDRADIKQFVDTPHIPATYTIFRNCLNELIRADIVSKTDLIPSSAEASLVLFSSPDAPSSRLWRCASKCVGFSGRTLGKMPVLMHAGYIQRKQCSLLEALDALEKTVNDELLARNQTDSDTRYGIGVLTGGS